MCGRRILKAWHAAETCFVQRMTFLHVLIQHRSTVTWGSTQIKLGPAYHEFVLHEEKCVPTYVHLLPHLGFAVNQWKWNLENCSQYQGTRIKRNQVYLHSLHTERTDEQIASKLTELKLSTRFLDVFSFDWFPPYRVLWSACYESWVILGPFYASFVLNGMAFTLQTLNVMWFTIIVRMVCDTIIAGKVFFTIPTILSRQGTKCYEYEVFG